MKGVSFNQFDDYTQVARFSIQSREIEWMLSRDMRRYEIQELSHSPHIEIDSQIKIFWDSSSRQEDSSRQHYDAKVVSVLLGKNEQGVNVSRHP